MKQSNKVKLNVLKLVNSGLNIIEITNKTGVTQKTVLKWINHWKKVDEPKLNTIKSIWLKIKELTENKNIDSSKILELSKSIEILQKQLLLTSKFSDM